MAYDRPWRPFAGACLDIGELAHLIQPHSIVLCTSIHGLRAESPSSSQLGLGESPG